jgi:thiamine-phosphate diphosphorylase/hydroxyethylthiazole kinase
MDVCFLTGFFCVTGCIIILTGVTDYVSDGSTVIKLDNGHELLAHITGSGCMVGTCVAVFCAAAAAASTVEVRTDKKLVDGDMLSGAIGG